MPDDACLDPLRVDVNPKLAALDHCKSFDRKVWRNRSPCLVHSVRDPKVLDREVASQLDDHSAPRGCAGEKCCHETSDDKPVLSCNDSPRDVRNRAIPSALEDLSEISEKFAPG